MEKLQGREDYLELTLGELLGQREDTRRVYVADGPFAGDVFDLIYKTIQIDHTFKDPRGKHAVRYQLHEYHVPLYNGTLFEIGLIWDLLYCSRPFDMADVGFVPPRIIRLDHECPEDPTAKAAWNDFAAAKRTTANAEEWDELEEFCKLTLSDAIELLGQDDKSKSLKTG